MQSLFLLQKQSHADGTHVVWQGLELACQQQIHLLLI